MDSAIWRGGRRAGERGIGGHSEANGINPARMPVVESLEGGEIPRLGAGNEAFGLPLSLIDGYGATLHSSRLPILFPFSLYIDAGNRQKVCTTDD